MIPKKFLSSQSLEKFVKGQGDALLMFSTPMCTACDTQEKIINQLWKNKKFEPETFKINIESKDSVLNYAAKTYGIKGFPFTLIIKGGKIKKTISGAYNYEAFLQTLAPFFNGGN
jgi:hypothetical protein